MPAHLINLKGLKFGRFTVLKRDKVAGYRACSYWYSLCRCGRMQSVRSSYLRWRLVTRCYDCSLARLKKKWERIRREKEYDAWYFHNVKKKHHKFVREELPMVISMKKTFTPKKEKDKIERILELRETNMDMKGISELLEIPLGMVKDVLKNKHLHER